MIDYREELNPAQYEAATTVDGSVLVIAGAGSGKTRTIVYRLAHLVETGVDTSSILLLTFTRKASQEMLHRARLLLNAEGHSSDMLLSSVQGGTFHAFAFTILRMFQPLGYTNKLTIMDSHDMLASLQHCREELKVGKGDRSFPKNQTILSKLSKSKNKEISLEDVLRKEAQHLLSHCDAMEAMGKAYQEFKREKGLLDYDDLLFSLEEVLRTREDALYYCRKKYRYIMVDEYQDTNPVQARITALIAGADTPSHLSNTCAGSSNIMVVGDDAQSIYAFRGADVRNILQFPEQFPNTKIIRLEENYRSTQPILDLANGILERATEGYGKHLFTRQEGGVKPRVIRPISDRTQASLVVSRIIELIAQYPANEVAVLFRSGFHSYHIEIQLNKLGIKFKKYGGIRYAEAAHVKDVMSFVRLVQNPLDYTAFARMAGMSKGVGPKTCLKLYRLALAGDAIALSKALTKYEDLAKDLAFIDSLRSANYSPATLLAHAVEQYKPRMPFMFPDDHPRRLQGLEQLTLIAASYSELDMFIADMSLEDPMQEEEEKNTVVLSTIHSAKGLEWSAVIILDLVEDRFPSRHSIVREEDFEEERRLMYVACTRARHHLDLFVPLTIYDRSSGGSIPSTPSPFVRELTPSIYEEWQESYTGGLSLKANRDYSYTGGSTGVRPLKAPTGTTHTVDSLRSFLKNSRPENNVVNEQYNEEDSPIESSATLPSSPKAPPEKCGFCHHKIFGRGKIVQHLPPDKYRVNFPGLGLKVIMGAYLSMENE